MRQTVGLLGRRVVRSIPELTTHVGKESNRLDEVEAGIEHHPDELWNEYPDPAARAELMLLFASAPAFTVVMLTEAAAMFTATGRRFAAMQHVLEAIPESRILDGGEEALASIPPGEREVLKERVQSFLEAHPDVAEKLEQT